MGDDSIDSVILHIGVGYLVTMVRNGRETERRLRVYEVELRFALAPLRDTTSVRIYQKASIRRLNGQGRRAFGFA